MSGKHKNWHLKWTLEVDGESAVHESGFAVRYDQAGGAFCLLDSQAMLTWQANQEAQGVRGDGALTRRVARLLREAEDLRAWRKTR